MPLRVLIVPDKLKGTLTAQEAAEALAQGWRRARPRDALDLLPMSDGGDGFGEVCGALFRARLQAVDTVDAAHRPCRSQWWWKPGAGVAVVESARTIGLAMLPPGRFHPFDLDTYGLGAVVQAAARKRARRCLLGLGGSATNDGGFGLARALGWVFLDRERRPIERWTNLDRLNRIQAPRHSRWLDEIVVAVDVQNPLLGRRGATRIYGPQKGLHAEDFALAERCLGRLADVARRHFGRDSASEPGAGAAGGLGFGLLAFLGAKVDPGFDLFARLASLQQHLRAADLVVTGEGAIDSSTFMGKGAGQIAQCCRALRIPCVALAGAVLHPTGARRHFTDVHSLTEMTSAREAKAQPARWLARLAERVARSSSWRTPSDGRRDLCVPRPD